eukprot:scaffold123921_cov66-Phaeocystis_antarctica.AAC.2
MTSGGLPGAAEVYQDQRATLVGRVQRLAARQANCLKFGGVENEQARTEESPCTVSAVGAARCRWAVLVHLKNAIPNPCAFPRERQTNVQDENEHVAPHR